jgi:transaldolase
LPEDRLRRLRDAGQSIWLDLLSRELVQSGELRRLIDEDSVTGVTSNPSIFQKAISHSGAYDDQIRRSLAETDDPRAVFFALAVTDVRDACDVFRPVFDASGGADGFVSLEVDPGLAFATEATFQQAVELHGRVDRPNLYVKIPATREGLPAIEDCIARGVPINVTLIFSLARYSEVVTAYRQGLERLAADGGDLARVSSVASFFVSRLDTEADARLERLAAAGGAGRGLEGRLGIASARLAYRHFRDAFSGPDWERLASAGARPQRPLWASTSTKNPAYRDVLYVEELIGRETVNTMPLETLEAFRDHGEVRGETVAEDVEAAERLLVGLAEAGVDYEDVVGTLEREGVQKFADAFDQLLAGIAARQGELTPR